MRGAVSPFGSARRMQLPGGSLTIPPLKLHEPPPPATIIIINKTKEIVEKRRRPAAIVERKKKLLLLHCLEGPSSCGWIIEGKDKGRAATVVGERPTTGVSPPINDKSIAGPALLLPKVNCHCVTSPLPPIIARRGAAAIPRLKCSRRE